MWPKFYRDYPPDTPLTKQRVESGKGIIGCEMHELNGWGHAYHITPREWKAKRWSKEENIPGKQ